MLIQKLGRFYKIWSFWPFCEINDKYAKNNKENSFNVKFTTRETYSLFIKPQGSFGKTFTLREMSRSYFFLYFLGVKDDKWLKPYLYIALPRNDGNLERKIQTDRQKAERLT